MVKPVSGAWVLLSLASGVTQQEILHDFPHLTEQNILACLSPAADREQRTMTIVVRSYFCKI
ncbi:DUF433 domain-containing protein [Picosynechococcus sp. PCC 7002]|uniref:DUF433 domain-containing protein n=1 Tax=Picosynechococcus sp. (strain ATCC 27264 / PCC 7002 / PR-6) TaxID=32049 RepID=UPI0002EEE0D0|nr:DUF433 domain-containing protein [Picosynechococcus sp. PCC 7002]